MSFSPKEGREGVTKQIVYGLIAARGRSRGLPGKNLKVLHGKPLISYIIHAALAAKTIDSVFVSSDSEEIAKVARERGAQVMVHPAQLSTATASTFGVVRNAARLFREKGSSPDVIVLMRPTSPLCQSMDIDRAVRMLMRHPEADSVISVVKSSVHPYRVLRMNRRGELEHFDKRSTERNFPQRRQSFGNVYIRNGAIYATRTRVIESGTLWGKHSLPYIMPKERSVNINDELDFLLAEALMK